MDTQQKSLKFKDLEYSLLHIHTHSTLVVKLCNQKSDIRCSHPGYLNQLLPFVAETISLVGTVAPSGSSIHRDSCSSGLVSSIPTDNWFQDFPFSPWLCHNISCHKPTLFFPFVHLWKYITQFWTDESMSNCVKLLKCPTLTIMIFKIVLYH